MVAECWAVTKRDLHKIDDLGQWCLRKLLGIKWYHYVRNDDVRQTTEQPHLSSTVQARRLSLFGHSARMPDESDAKQILSASPPAGELEETIRTLPQYVDEDYSAGPEISEPDRERSNRHGSESSTLEIDVHVWRYALIVVHARNERTNDVSVLLSFSRQSLVTEIITDWIALAVAQTADVQATKLVAICKQ